MKAFGLLIFSESDLVCIMRVSYKLSADQNQTHYRFKYYLYEDFKAKKEPIVEYTGIFDGYTCIAFKALNNHSKISWSEITKKPV